MNESFFPDENNTIFSSTRQSKLNILDDLDNVSIVNKQPNDILIWNGSTWINEQKNGGSAFISVNTISSLYTLPHNNRMLGMICYVNDCETYYGLYGGIDNDNWIGIGKFFSGSQNVNVNTGYNERIYGGRRLAGGNAIMFGGRRLLS